MIELGRDIRAHRVWCFAAQLHASCRACIGVSFSASLKTSPHGDGILLDDRVHQIEKSWHPPDNATLRAWLAFAFQCGNSVCFQLPDSNRRQR
jgi:hypothetical protein